jgi:hypothetical protein
MRPQVGDRLVGVGIEALHDDLALAELHHLVEEVVEHGARLAQRHRQLVLRARVGLDDEPLLEAAEQVARRVRQRPQAVGRQVEAHAVARAQVDDLAEHEQEQQDVHDHGEGLATFVAGAGATGGTGGVRHGQPWRLRASSTNVLA